jgi:hypothetical protein
VIGEVAFVEPAGEARSQIVVTGDGNVGELLGERRSEQGLVRSVCGGND